MITGGARSIGAAIAQTFAMHGAKGIAIVDIDLQAAQQTAKEIETQYQCQCIALQANVAKEEDVIRVFDEFFGVFSHLDVMVNNAGICKMVTIADLKMSDWDRTMDINLKGTFLFCREAFLRMQQQKSGKIINMASQAGKIGGIVAGADYSASKAGVLCLTKTFAKAAAPHNINVNSIAPGLIGTDMTVDFGYDAKNVPLGRIGTAQEVADVTLFLASDLSRYMTGACLDVNGGMSMW